MPRKKSTAAHTRATARRNIRKTAGRVAKSAQGQGKHSTHVMAASLRGRKKRK